MGNCLRRESCSDRWTCDDDDEWEYTEKGSVILGKRLKREEGPLLCSDDETGFPAKGSHSISTSSLTEVKIKITKKQLQQLLGKMDKNEVSMHEALAQLIEVSSDQHHSHERPWRPVLQSIPEVN